MLAKKVYKKLPHCDYISLFKLQPQYFIKEKSNIIDPGKNTSQPVVQIGCLFFPASCQDIQADNLQAL